MDEGQTSLDLLTGKTNQHVVIDQRVGLPVHQEVVAPLILLKEEAKKVGFQLRVISGHRSFKGQQSIWNTKARGQRPLLDEFGAPLNYDDLSPEEIVESILRWSALPGASRHHWGTDLDIIDHRAIPTPDYIVDLTPQEVADDGIFGPFHQWLDQLIKDHKSFGFFRPYAKDQGGVRPERWHISYRPLSQTFLEEFTFDRFYLSLKDSEMDLKDIVLKRAEEIYQKFVINISD